MHRLTIFENDDTEPASARLLDAQPAADTTIRLNGLARRSGSRSFDPLVADIAAVRT